MRGPKHQAFLADRFIEDVCPICGYLDARGDQCDRCGNPLDPLQIGSPKCKIDGTTTAPREIKHTFLLLAKKEGTKSSAAAKGPELRSEQIEAKKAMKKAAKAGEIVKGKAGVKNPVL